MPTPNPMPDESVTELLPLRSKKGRAKDAETIRLEFIRSQETASLSVGAEKTSARTTENER